MKVFLSKDFSETVVVKRGILSRVTKEIKPTEDFLSDYQAKISIAGTGLFGSFLRVIILRCSVKPEEPSSFCKGIILYGVAGGLSFHEDFQELTVVLSVVVRQEGAKALRL